MESTDQRTAPSNESSVNLDVRSITAVYVRWRDAHADADSWTYISDIEDTPYIVQTVGLLVENLKSGHVSIAQSFGAEEGVVDHVIHIPYEMVDMIQYIEIGDGFLTK